ncbi:MAG: prepilin-type N-terminal cleavage/methylation domain-containing protein [Oscillospiraceae bacterium]|nr:prepilin-type N-terminal cleavage/methylation domain-containing protein [Oscillospiraceae bacterium]
MLKKAFRFLYRTNKDDAGFTIIELLIAFTILAIMAGSLFQIFYVSESNNLRAVENDYANSIAIAAIELFKSDPENSDDYTKYFDYDWDEISDVWTMYEGSLPPEAWYILETRLDKETVSAHEGAGDSEAAVTIDLDALETYRLVITDVAGELEVRLNGAPLNIDFSRIGSTIPIKAFFNQIGVLPKRILVTNNSDVPIVLNIFNIPESSINDARALNSLVTVTPLDGSVGTSYYGADRQVRERYIYYFDVTVKKVQGAGRDIDVTTAADGAVRTAAGIADTGASPDSAAGASPDSAAGAATANATGAATDSTAGAASTNATGAATDSTAGAASTADVIAAASTNAGNFGAFELLSCRSAKYVVY